MKASKVTPLMKQYNDIKSKYPDAILLFTDPRFWLWVFGMEHEIRQNIPIFYYALWDNLPDCAYNNTAYASCDLMMAISKQSYGIHSRVLDEYGVKVIDVHKIK